MAKKKPARARGAKKPPARVVNSIAAVAKSLGLSSRVVADYLARGCPGKPGNYDLDAIDAWRALHVEAKQKKAPQDLASVAALQLKKLQREVGKLGQEVRAKRNKNRRDEANYYEKDVVDQFVGEAFARIRNRLEAIPDELEMTFPLETRELNKSDARAKIAGILREMAKWSIDTV